ncbi:MAG: chemotaxis protein CheX [Pirellulaceae bacterium]|nr:chemotaxis protein CheX [Pirellulaceae bacterium]
MLATYEAEVEQILQSVYATMLGVDAVRDDNDFAPDEECLIAAIQITGAWTGCVTLGLAPATARGAAAAMLQIPAAEVTAADQEDTAAELVNMTGGNLKSVLPGPSSLSLPTVVAGRHFGFRVQGAELLHDLWFDSSLGGTRLRVYARQS